MARLRVLPEGMVEIKAEVPREVRDALDTVAVVSGGVTRATLIRRAVVELLRSYDLVSPDLARTLDAMPAMFCLPQTHPEQEHTA